MRKGIDFRAQRERKIRAQWVKNQSAMEDESEGNITAQRERDESANGAQRVHKGCAKAQNQSAIQAKSEGSGSATGAQWGHVLR